MYQYSPSEKQFVKVGLSYGLRVDGRTPDMRRTTEVKCDVLDNLAGSSYISIDHGKCEIYTGIKLKISNTTEGSSLQPKINVSLSSMRKLSREQNDIMVYLQQLLELHFINKEIKGFKQLYIPNSRRHNFELHIETFILAEPHLSLVQPLYLAIKKALGTTSVPKLDCFYNETTNEQTVQLTYQEQNLTVGEIDALVLVGQQQKTLILDMTPLQFQSVDSVLLITVKGQKVQSVQSLKGSISSQEMHKICRFAINGSK